MADAEPAANAPQTLKAAVIERNPRDEFREVFEFFQFAVKPNATWRGTAVFDIWESAVNPRMIMSARINPDGSVSIYDGLPPDGVYTCYSECSRDDFFFVYSGTASAATVASLILTGRIRVRWFRFHEVQAFALSFDYATPTWVKFYRQKGREQRARVLLQQHWQRSKTKGLLMDGDGNVFEPSTLTEERRVELLKLCTALESDEAELPVAAPTGETTVPAVERDSASAGTAVVATQESQTSAAEVPSAAVEAVAVETPTDVSLAPPAPDSGRKTEHDGGTPIRVVSELSELLVQQDMSPSAATASGGDVLGSSDATSDAAVSMDAALLLRELLEYPVPRRDEVQARRIDSIDAQSLPASVLPPWEAMVSVDEHLRCVVDTALQRDAAPAAPSTDGQPDADEGMLARFSSWWQGLVGSSSEGTNDGLVDRAAVERTRRLESLRANLMDDARDVASARLLAELAVPWYTIGMFSSFRSIRYLPSAAFDAPDRLPSLAAVLEPARSAMELVRDAHRTLTTRASVIRSSAFALSGMDSLRELAVPSCATMPQVGEAAVKAATARIAAATRFHLPETSPLPLITDLDEQAHQQVTTSHVVRSRAQISSPPAAARPAHAVIRALVTAAGRVASGSSVADGGADGVDTDFVRTAVEMSADGTLWDASRLLSSNFSSTTASTAQPADSAGTPSAELSDSCLRALLLKLDNEPAGESQPTPILASLAVCTPTVVLPEWFSNPPVRAPVTPRCHAFWSRWSRARAQAASNGTASAPTLSPELMETMLWCMGAPAVCYRRPLVSLSAVQLSHSGEVTSDTSDDVDVMVLPVWHPRRLLCMQGRTPAKRSKPAPTAASPTSLAPWNTSSSRPIAYYGPASGLFVSTARASMRQRFDDIVHDASQLASPAAPARSQSTAAAPRGSPWMVGPFSDDETFVTTERMAHGFASTVKAAVQRVRASKLMKMYVSGNEADQSPGVLKRFQQRIMGSRSAPDTGYAPVHVPGFGPTAALPDTWRSANPTASRTDGAVASTTGAQSDADMKSGV